LHKPSWGSHQTEVENVALDIAEVSEMGTKLATEPGLELGLPLDTELETGMTMALLSELGLSLVGHRSGHDSRSRIRS